MSEIIIWAVDSLLDCLEEIGEISIYTTKSILQTLIIVLCIFLFSVGCRIVGIFTFISWQESLTALIIMCILMFVNMYITGETNKFLDKIKVKRRK